MAPRTGHRVRIISPNSGTVTLSRSASLHSSRSRTNASSSSIQPTYSRPPLQAVDSNRMGYGNFSTKSNSSLHHSAVATAWSATAPAPEGSHGSSSHLQSPQHSSSSSTRSKSRGEGREAIKRAQETLDAAGQHVLKKPFGGNANHQLQPQTQGDNASGSGGGRVYSFNVINTTSSSGDSSGTASKAALQLRQSIVGLQKQQSRSRSSYNTSRGSSASVKRPRSSPSSSCCEPLVCSHGCRVAVGRAERQLEIQEMSGQGHLGILPRKRANTNITYSRAVSSGGPLSLDVSVPSHSNTDLSSVLGAKQRPVVATGVCPAMFSGLSSIPLCGELFECADGRPANLYYDTVPTEDRGYPPPPQEGSRGTCPRRCVRPLWSLVGTFKTALGSVVNVDYGNDCLNWQQRNPKGGFQRIRVPLHAVLDAVTARISREDEGIQEKQFTAIVRTSARPSQVIFGFGTAREANEFRAMVRPRGL